MENDRVSVNGNEISGLPPLSLLTQSSSWNGNEISGLPPLSLLTQSTDVLSSSTVFPIPATIKNEEIMVSGSTEILQENPESIESIVSPVPSVPSVPSNPSSIIIWNLVLHSLPYSSTIPELRPTFQLKSTDTEKDIDTIETVYDSLFQYPSPTAIPIYPITDSIDDIALLNTSIVCSINTVFSGQIEITMYHNRPSVPSNATTNVSSSSLRNLWARLSPYRTSSFSSSLIPSTTTVPDDDDSSILPYEQIEIFHFTCDCSILRDHAAQAHPDEESCIFTVPSTALSINNDVWKVLPEFTIDIVYGSRNQTMFKAGLERKRIQEEIAKTNDEEKNIYVNEKRIQQSKDPKFILEQEVLASMLLENSTGYSV